MTKCQNKCVFLKTKLPSLYYFMGIYMRVRETQYWKPKQITNYRKIFHFYGTLRERLWERERGRKIRKYLKSIKFAIIFFVFILWKMTKKSPITRNISHSSLSFFVAAYERAHECEREEKNEKFESSKFLINLFFLSTAFPTSQKITAAKRNP